MNNRYRAGISRNLGILSEQQQLLVKNTKIFIIGCGGIGSIAAEAFARTGVEKFILCDFDIFEESNLNRQAGCFESTLGQPKVEVLADRIRDINSQADVTVLNRKLEFEEIKKFIQESDFVFPAADDFAFSVGIFDLCKIHRKPALMVVPIGLWGVTTVIPPDSHFSVRHIHGLPKISKYEDLRDLLENDIYRKGRLVFTKKFKWSHSWYDDFIAKQKPLAQICPLVWSISSIGVLESIKYIAGLGCSAKLPRYYQISASSIKKKSLIIPSFSSSFLFMRGIYSNIKINRRKK
ncbi:MAG: ThiF family adenylyltransferase [Spirochaetales bacterium]|nr:ThiF family adenylyltransferase [Spirochaetales bacterium]